MGNIGKSFRTRWGRSKLKLSIPLALFAAFLLFLRPIELCGDTAYVVVLGKSMEPTIPLGALVITKSSDYGEGDIIAFRTPYADTIFVHRIIEAEKSPEGVRFVTKGDAARNPDGWRITPEMVLGKRLIDIPYLGFTCIFLRSPLGLVLTTIAVFFIIFPASGIIDFFRKRSGTRNGERVDSPKDG